MVDSSPSTEQRTLSALEEIARWTKFMGLVAAREAVKDVLRTEEDRAIFHLSSGLSSREIEKVLRVSRSTVQGRWAKWQAIGIVKDSERWKGRKEAVFSLAELGLDVPSSVANYKSSELQAGAPETNPTPTDTGPSKSIEMFDDPAGVSPPPG